MEASFYALYCRGRFRSHADDDEERMRQSERFGVAILGLCLRHDPEFRRHFLGKICGADEFPELAQSDFRVLVDPSCTWADLLLESNDRVIVIECKLNAELKRKQNPEKIEFTGEDGYGKALSERYPHRELHFIVLQKHREFHGLKSPLGIRCHAKTWSELVRDARPQSMEADLYDSLGSLGYDDFQFMKTRNTCVKNHALLIAKSMLLLDNVARELDLGNIPVRADVSDDKYAEVGKDINKGNNKAVKELAEVVGPADKYIAWFGYEVIDGVGFLSVCFYCKDVRGAEAVLSKVATMKRDVPSKEVGEEHFVVFRKRAEESNSDQQWFLDVLKPVFPAR